VLGYLEPLFDLVCKGHPFEPNNCTMQKCHHLARIISSVGRTNSIVRDDQGLVLGAEKFGPKTQAAGLAQGSRTARHQR
jgi:hypothetical protein